MTISKAKKGKTPERRREIGLVDLPEETLLTVEVDGRPLGRLSGSPGARKELVLGWLFSQGLIAAAGDVAALRLRKDRASVRLRPGAASRLDRRPQGVHPGSLQVTACSGGTCNRPCSTTCPGSSGTTSSPWPKRQR